MSHITRVWHEDVREPESARPPSDQSGATRGIADTETRRGHTAVMPRVTVVLVARAGPTELTRSLEALGNQTYPSHLLEVIAVCASHDAGTARAVAALARRRAGLRLRFISCAAEHGLGAARNCGWRRATGSIVAFTTDAVVPSPRWVESAVAAFDPIVDVVGGQVVVPLDAHPSVPVRRAAERLRVPWTAHNVFYRRSLLRELDGFDEAYQRQGHDDTDLIFAALTVGARFCAAEGAVVVHSDLQATWRGEVTRHLPHADDARLYRKHPRLAAQYMRPSASMGEYVPLAAICGAAVCAGTGHRSAAKVATALWVGVTFAQVRRAARDSAREPRELLSVLAATVVLQPISAALRLYGALRHRVWFR